MIKLLGFFIVASIMAMGLSAVDAKELTANIEVYSGNVTIPLKHPVEQLEAKYHPDYPRVWTEVLILGPYINGTWNGDENPYNLSTDTDDGCLEGYSRDLDNLPMCIPDEQLTREALEKCYESTDCPVGWWDDGDGNVVNNQKPIDEDPGDIVNDAPDDSYKCGYDIGLYQNEDKFDVPIEVWIDESGQTHVRLYQDTGIKADNFTSDEDLAVQACLGQWDLEKRQKHGSEFGVSTVPNSEDYFPHHSDVAFGLPPIGADRLNELQNEGLEKDNDPTHPLICKLYSQRTQVALGCDVKTSDGINDESKKTDLENVIPEWMENRITQFNEDGGAAMAKEKQRENIFEEMDRLRKQLAGLE